MISYSIDLRLGVNLVTSTIKYYAGTALGLPVVGLTAAIRSIRDHDGALDLLHLAAAVSALIHAATMVTAGIYLSPRFNERLLLVGAIPLRTLDGRDLRAALSALCDLLSAVAVYFLSLLALGAAQLNLPATMIIALLILPLAGTESAEAHRALLFITAGAPSRRFAIGPRELEVSAARLGGAPRDRRARILSCA